MFVVVGKAHSDVLAYCEYQDTDLAPATSDLLLLQGRHGRGRDQHVASNLILTFMLERLFCAFESTFLLSLTFGRLWMLGPWGAEHGWFCCVSVVIYASSCFVLLASNNPTVFFVAGSLAHFYTPLHIDVFP